MPGPTPLESNTSRLVERRSSCPHTLAATLFVDNIGLEPHESREKHEQARIQREWRQGDKLRELLFCRTEYAAAPELGTRT